MSYLKVNYPWANHEALRRCFSVRFHSAMSVSHLHCKKLQSSKIISAISFRLHLCLGSTTVANTHSKRRQDTWAQISWLGWHWKTTPKIQECFPFPISQHYNANIPPAAKGPTSTLFLQMTWTYIFYAWMGSHVIHSPLLSRLHVKCDNWWLWSEMAWPLQHLSSCTGRAVGITSLVYDARSSTSV